MQTIPNLFQSKNKTYSFELFPPKTDKGFENLKETIGQLARLKPDFFSCTYGAGGGGRDKTFDIVQYIEQEHHIIAMAHLTCVLNTKNDIKNILEDVKSRGVKNILALRGDPPADNPNWQPDKDNFRYSSELCAFIREQFKEEFGVGVAGFPEGHLLCPDREKDADYLKLKIDNGADFVITQIFFNNKDYFDYLERLRKRDIHNRVLPGILPITNYASLLRFSSLCGASIPQTVRDIFEPIQNDPDATLEAGINFAIKQCRELLAGGAPGIHFYALNKLHPVDAILKAVRRM